MSFILFIILVLLFAALFVVGIGLSILGQLLGGVGNAYRLVKQALGFGRSQGKAGFDGAEKQHARNRQNHSARPNNQSRKSTKRGRSDKMFQQDEGEYVDFEEVKVTKQ